MNGIENSAPPTHQDGNATMLHPTPASNEQTSLASSESYSQANQASQNTPVIYSESPQATSELFKTEEVQSLSPKAEWIKRHGLRIEYLPPKPAKWKIGRFKGASEDEVLAKYAKRKNLKLWNEEMSQKMFRFTVENMATGNTGCFAGDGETIVEAWKDAMKNLDSTFRPKQSGGFQRPSTMAVTLKDGKRTVMTTKEFESGSSGEVEFV